MIDGDFVYSGSWDHYVHALELAAWQLRWRFHVDGAFDSGTAAAKEGRLYLPSGDSDAFRCLDGKTGEVIWAFERG